MNVLEQIESEDTMYRKHLEATLVAASGVSKERFSDAENYLYGDGYYGPFDPDEFAECHGCPRITREEALDIVRSAQEGVEAFWSDDLECLIQPSAILCERFHYLSEIYGHYHV